jgi:ABC-type Fe3+-hydroxamate transport system substrate-binding protein
MPDKTSMDERIQTYEMESPVSEPPRRVVSLVPSVTESLFDLNLGDHLVAITDYCVRPEAGVAHLPRIGGTKNPDVEQIIALKPDLVIANQEENRKRDVEALQATGIPVWVTYPKTVSDVFKLLWNIMYLFDETTMVPRVRLIEYTYDWVNGISRANEEKLPKVFVPIWYDPLMTLNADTYIHDLLLVCGGVNVFGGHKDSRYPRVSLEEVVSAQPDVILLPSEPFEFTEAHIPIFSELDVPAAKNNRIHLVDGSLLTWHGTRIAYAFETLPALLQDRHD